MIKIISHLLVQIIVTKNGLIKNPKFLKGKLIYTIKNNIVFLRLKDYRNLLYIIPSFFFFKLVKK